MEGESKRGKASLKKLPSPSPFLERGIKGVRLVNNFRGNGLDA
jgi:hypothetical protein